MYHASKGPTVGRAKGRGRGHSQAGNGDYKMATWPVRIDGKTVRLRGSPALGQDSAEVLQNWLGIDTMEIEALRQEEVL